MNDDEIVRKLAEASEFLDAVRLAELLEKLTSGGLNQGTMITFFKRAVPAIPLGTLLNAAAWNRLTDGGLSDAQFNQFLSRWLPASKSPPATV